MLEWFLEYTVVGTVHRYCIFYLLCFALGVHCHYAEKSDSRGRAQSKNKHNLTKVTLLAYRRKAPRLTSSSKLASF